MSYTPGITSGIQSVAEATAASGTVTSGTTSSGTSDPPGLGAWMKFTQQYQDQHNSAGLPKHNFWIVIALRASDFSEQLENHETVPMLMPKIGAGTFLGIVGSQKEATELMDKDRKRVHLLYKMRIQGQDSWRDLLTFLAEHNMLETEPN